MYFQFENIITATIILPIFGILTILGAEAEHEIIEVLLSHDTAQKKVTMSQWVQPEYLAKEFSETNFFFIKISTEAGVVHDFVCLSYKKNIVAKHCPEQQ